MTSDPWAITDDEAFMALIFSDDPVDEAFVNMIPYILGDDDDHSA